MRHVCRSAPCRVGGGIRTIDRAREVLAAGATHVIVGSSFFRDGRPELIFAQALADAVSPDRVIGALDAKGGQVAIEGWRRPYP